MWALGVLAYELLMGRSPFAGGDGFNDDDALVHRIAGALGGCHGLLASAEARAFVEARVPHPSLSPTAPTAVLRLRRRSSLMTGA